jgi:hypothetical protein
MQQTSQRTVFGFLLLLIFVSGAIASRYQYLSDCEQTRFGEWIRFWHGDTLDGCVRTNGCFGIMQDPQFYDCVIMGCSEPEHGTGYNPGFHGGSNSIIYNAPPLPFPTRAEELRQGALIQGHFFSEPGKSYRVSLRGSSVKVYEWWTGTLFDSAADESYDIPLVGPTCMFFDDPLEVLGHLHGQLTLGSSHNVYLMDDIWYDCAIRSTHGYSLPQGFEQNCGDILEIVSERDIKIANTYANGRNDSNLRGNNQSHSDSTDIVIMAQLVALGESFTFEQQNDADSGYVFQHPEGTSHIDDRGQIFLLGALIQRRRGYVHRSNSGSTGYLKQYKFDLRFPHMNPPCDFQFYNDPRVSTDTVDFGGIPIGHTVWDTAYVYPSAFSTLGSVLATPPFTALRIEPFQGDNFAIPVSLTASHAGVFSGILQVSTAYQFYQIVLRGQGLPGGAPPHFDISPNPFNAITSLRFDIPEPGAVKITLYDVLGRVAKQLDFGNMNAGDHNVQVNASDLASGVYFVHLQTAGQTLTRKMLLLK